MRGWPFSAVGCGNRAPGDDVGVQVRGFLPGLFVSDQSLDFLAQLDGEAEEFFGIDEFEGAIGQFVVDVLLQAGEAVEVFFMGGEDLLFEKLQFEGAQRLDILGEFAVPIDQGAFGDVEFGGDMAQAPALGAEFDEFIVFIGGVHGG